MGILDDAIREHLELKRRHGASDDEIRRQEDEAFGHAAAAADLPPPLADAGAAHRTEAAPDVNGAGAAGAEREQPDLDAARQPDIDEVAFETSAERDAVDPSLSAVEHRELPPERSEAAGAPSPLPADEELDPDEVLPEEALDFEPSSLDAPAPLEPDEDLLEETPEFLEEAPDQDRLWFEQKPPKDFDFDD